MSLHLEIFHDIMVLGLKLVYLIGSLQNSGNSLVRYALSLVSKVLHTRESKSVRRTFYEVIYLCFMLCSYVKLGSVRNPMCHYFRRDFFYLRLENIRFPTSL